LKATLKQAWIEDLTSGKFEQGRIRLRYTDGTKERYCCLGVLCECAIRNGYAVNKVDSMNVDGVCYYGCNDAYPNSHVLTNALMEELGIDVITAIDLAIMNDDAVPFDDIAEEIKKIVVED